MSGTKTKKNKPVPALGILYIEFLRMEIPVFFTDQDRRAALAHLGIDSAPTDRPHAGLACIDYDEAGHPMVTCVLPADSRPSTWVHEASHLVDFAMDLVGMPPDMSNTETRAYLLQYLFDQISALFDDFKAHEVKRRAKERARKKAAELKAAASSSSPSAAAA